MKPLFTCIITALAATTFAGDWKPLFNGKDLSEFTVEDGQATYEVKDGIITGTTAVPSPNTFLSTKAVYGDFELEFEVKVSDQLNSGVQIRSRSRAEDEGKFKAGRFYGPQVEIEAGPGQAGYIYGEATGRGWLSPEPKSKDPAINTHSHFKNGEWNHYRIIAQGARIQTFINGQPVADLSDEEIYKTHPKGHIGLQVHSINKKLHPMTVSWKNLKIREIENKEWTSLFNGKNLDGWIVKIARSELGQNPGNMFRVADECLTVSYDDLEGPFNNQFGHIHTENAYTNFRFRCEYRFIGEQVANAPKWAFANSGIMLNCPHPSTMDVNQNFPNSAECQLLGVNRTTGSLFTPGSKVTYEGADMAKSVKSKLPSLPLDEWVKAEAVVKDGTIQHWINGELIMEYSNPRLLDGTPMTGGHIALQSESHPCQFRNIEILVLD